MRSRGALSVVALLIASCATPEPERGEPAETIAAAPEPSEWDRELPVGWQLDDLAGDGEVAVVPIRVVADLSGEGIPGARIDNWWEAEAPHAEPWETLLEGSYVTDRDGWAVLPSREHGNWYYVDAAGYGPMAEMGLNEEFRLVPGADFELEVQDWLGRPAPGAVVDFVLGCGHTPNARCETADSNGRFVLRCVHATRGDLWIRAEGIAGRSDGYGGWDDLPERDGVRILRGDPSVSLEGRVLRADGTPAAGAWVGTIEAHRGPWTTTDADGRYRLVGAVPRDDLIAMAPPTDPVPEGFATARTEFLSVPGVFAVVGLPAAGERKPTKEEREAKQDAERAESEAYARGEEPEPVVAPEGPGVRVKIAAAARGVTPVGRVGILAVRDGDGEAHETFPILRDGVASRSVALTPGTWTVTAGDEFGSLRPESRRVEITSGWTDLAFTLDENPVWKPRVVERSADGSERELSEEAVKVADFKIISPRCQADATPHRDERGEDGAIYVPASGRFLVKYSRDFGSGRPVRMLFDAPPSPDTPALVVPAKAAEEPWVDEIDRPREFPRSRLQVLLPDGRTAAGVGVTLRWPSRARSRTPGFEEASVELDDDGSAECAFDRGSYVEAGVESDEDGVVLLPLRARIDGPGPWTLRWPTGTVEVRARDEYGVPISDFRVCLNGWDTIAAKDGTVRLRGVGTEPLRIWVGAEGRRPHDVRLVLAAGEARAITVTLRPSAKRL